MSLSLRETGASKKVSISHVDSVRRAVSQQHGMAEYSCDTYLVATGEELQEAYLTLLSCQRLRARS